MALAAELQRMMPVVAGVHPGRLAPVLTRFATAPTPWTAQELATAVHRMLAGRGWVLRAPKVQPAAYLARLLRDLDHLDQDATAPTTALVTDLPDPAVAARRRELELASQREIAADLAGRLSQCRHGVGGADAAGRASRCAYCRQS